MQSEDPSKQALPSLATLRARLGARLRDVRIAAGVTTRGVASYSSGHISNVENGRTTPSAALIGEYVHLGGDAASLLHLLDQIHRAGRTDTAPRSSDPVDAALGDPRSDPRMLRRGYDVDAVEDLNLIGADGQPGNRQHTVSIRTTSARARFFPFRHSVPEQPRRGTSLLEAGAGCSIAVIEESTNGGLFAVLEFDPTERDVHGRCTFTWSITLRLDPGVLATPMTVSGTKARISRAVHRVQFADSHVPAAVWWWRGFDEQEGLMDPTPDRILPTAPNAQYSREFLDTEAEWWGLGWAWA